MWRLVSSLLFATVLASCAVSRSDQNTETVLHLPIRRQARQTWRRDGQIVDVGLGDVLDVTYNVLCQVGDTLAPLVIDTGSADLWLASDYCGDNCSRAGVPLYPQQALTPAGQDVHLLYGDSRTGTHATGPIGTDTVGIAGLSVSNQYFAAIVDTNTTVLQTGSAGILGLGFPPISVIWRQVFASNLNWTAPSIGKRLTPSVARNLSASDYASHDFPSFDFLHDGISLRKRQNSQQNFVSAIDSFPTLGPLLTRFVIWNVLSRPIVVTTLQRDTFSLGGNAGTLSLGELPFGLTDTDLVWVPVRGYAAAEGGLPPSPDAPDEVYPLVWEIPLEDVYFDGIRLPYSTLSPPSISLSALVDTGNSLIRGPQDVVGHVLALLGETFDCSVPHNLSFQIGGAMFPVDPRDFAHPATIVHGVVYPNKAAQCTPALAGTDPPSGGGFLYSWSLGDPFLKSTLVAFYYGNITHPSRDPPRVGLLSTVPADAASELEDAVIAAVRNGGVFPSTSEPPSYATANQLRTMTLANVGPEVTQGSQRARSGAAPHRVAPPPVGVALWTSSLIVITLVGVLDYLYG